MGQTAGSGDTVRVHYTGKLDDGTVFDSSADGEPLEFELGAEEVIQGFERALDGMEAGQRKQVRLAPEEAYGERRDDLVFDVPRDELPDGYEPQKGEELAVEVNSGREVPAYVKNVKDEAVTLDLNHPLAGRELLFEVELVEIV